MLLAQLVRRKRNTATPFLIGGAALLAMEAARRAFRISKVFCPTHEPLRGSWRPEDHGLDPERSQEVWIETDDGASLFGWYVRAKNPLASVVYCHGNTGNLPTPHS